MKHSPGHLVVIGGAEDRQGDMPVLQKVVALSPRQRPVFVVTAATEDPAGMWHVYEKAFGQLGVKQVEPLHVHARDQANDADTAARVAKAGAVFMTGGDQTRLLAALGGTRLCEAIRDAYVRHGACVAGTSAGASAMSEHVLSALPADRSPLAVEVNLMAGLGLLLSAAVDQHFSERGRLSRLLAVVAHNPKLVGVGIDENTALVVSRGEGIEVVGAGAVTLVDGREMHTGLVGEPGAEVFQATDVRVHLLPSGSGPVRPAAAAGGWSPNVRSLVRLLCANDGVDTLTRGR
jgi:cyanophycinase